MVPPLEPIQFCYLLQLQEDNFDPGYKKRLLPSRAGKNVGMAEGVISTYFAYVQYRIATQSPNDRRYSIWQSAGRCDVAT